VDNWRKSTYSQGDSGCVEWASTVDAVGMRDSKDPRPVLVFGRSAWRAFIEAVKANQI
jgi:hypothetical protein